jgi:hypothetical protein
VKTLGSRLFVWFERANWFSACAEMATAWFIIKAEQADWDKFLNTIYSVDSAC